MAIWIKLNPKIPIARLVANTKFKIIRWDMEQNAFRFGFASMDETELIQAVESLKTELEKG